MIGTTVDHFEIIEELGRGGMARVYKAWDSVLNRHVALKVLNAGTGPADVSDYDQVLHEARAASRLDHPNIAPVYEVRSAHDRTFLVMQLVDGPSLRQKLAGGILPVEEARRLALCIARGLAEAHRAGVLHRDVKPENVLLTERGEVKLTDFGLAKVMTADSQTATGVIRGTPGYMPPEVLSGEPPDARADVFSAGVLFYELFSGKNPFMTSPHAALVLNAILTEHPPFLADVRPEVPEALARIIHRAMEKDPSRRYADAGELLQALEEEDDEATRSPSGYRKLQRESTRSARTFERRIRWGMGVVLAAVVVAGVLEFTGNRKTSGRFVVSGIVRDLDSQPVMGARVTVDGHSFMARTSSDGRFWGELVDGLPGESVLLRVSHDRYSTVTQWMALDGDRADTLNFSLQRIE
jgi:serine/threonine protein kinase